VDYRLRKASHQRAHRHRLPGVRVEARQLAVSDEAREAHVPLLELLARDARRVAGKHLLAGPHQPPALRAEAVEALRSLAGGHHDCFVVTADEPPLDSLP